MTMKSAPVAEGSWLAIGLMSGTSVDGIDASLSRYSIVLDRNNASNYKIVTELISSHGHPLPVSTKKRIFDLFEDRAGSLQSLALLDMELGELFADAANELLRKAGMNAKDITVIGSHGQTIRHVAGDPGGRASLQIGSGSVIAQRTDIPTACDFRPGDIAAGGTGAPLVPFFAKTIADGFPKPVAFQNFGGIGNVCWIPESGNLVAFDTGPGNMIADMLAFEASDGELRFDRDGLIGLKGTIREDLVTSWLSHGYFAKTPPKSSGREEFGSAFYDRELGETVALAKANGDRGILQDLVRSAEAFSARATARAYKLHLPAMPKTVIVSGGGAHNPVIMAELRLALPCATVLDADAAGFSIDYMEAAAFGLFGLLRFLGLPNTLPESTGARHAVCAGALFLPNRQGETE